MVDRIQSSAYAAYVRLHSACMEARRRGAYTYLIAMAIEISGVRSTSRGLVAVPQSRIAPEQIHEHLLGGGG